MPDYEIKTIKIDDQLYPALLKEISNPPKTLYYIGEWPNTNLFPLAIVGSRESDIYGEEAINSILNDKISKYQQKFQKSKSFE